MIRHGVVSPYQVFTCDDWPLRVLSRLLWSSLVWTGAVCEVIINIGILGQAGIGRARKDTTWTKETTPD